LRAAADPVALRRAHLADERARVVLDAAVDAAGWEPRTGPSGAGRGVALARYDGTKAYVAVVAEVDAAIDADRLAVTRLVVAADAGTIVNPEGLRQQLEGGALQGLSRALHERLRVDRRGVRSRDWSTYPVLRFDEVPALELVLIDRRGTPPLGAGEAATPPVPAAVANAVDDATGIRLRRLPMTPKAMRDRLIAMDADETDRVLAAPAR
jgi:nicotinate dehydrogenase subunit B